jgi:hypothetical protein
MARVPRMRSSILTVLMAVSLMGSRCTPVRGDRLDKQCNRQIGHSGSYACELGVEREWRKHIPGLLRGLFIDRYRPADLSSMEGGFPAAGGSDLKAAVAYAWYYLRWQTNNTARAEFFLRAAVSAFELAAANVAGASLDKVCEVHLFIVMLLIETASDPKLMTAYPVDIRASIERSLTRAVRRCRGSVYRPFIDLARNEYLLTSGGGRKSCANLAKARHTDRADVKCTFALQSACCARYRGLIGPTRKVARP